MRIKPSKNILILALALFFMHGSYGQLSQNAFLQRTSVSVGIGFSKIISDSIYDQDLGRMSYGLNYTHPMNENIDIDFGILYNQRGGKSFYEGTLQSFGFIDAPLRMSYKFGDDLKMGLGFQPSYNLFNYTIKRGERSVLDPNPHPYYPKVVDYGVTGSVDINLSDNTSLGLMAMYSFNGSTKVETPLNLGQLGLHLRIGLGGSAQKIEDITYESRRTEIDLVRLKSGYVIVCLSDRQVQSDYYKNKGDTAKARATLKDAYIKNKSIKQAFIEHYNYSKVVFIDVKDLANVCSGSRNAQIEDSEGNKVSIESINSEFFVFFKPGTIYGNVSGFSKNGYEFVDKECKRLEDPFPSEEFAMPGHTDDMKRMVKDLNRRMQTREASIRSKKYFSEDLLNVVY
ncbi:MAG: outer membrane beta-barrel protein [Bacteroidia bacterium]